MAGTLFLLLRKAFRASFTAEAQAVRQGDAAHPVLGEVPLHVVAGEDVIPPRTGEVLGKDHVDFLSLNVSDHPLKAGAVKCCPHVTEYS